MVLTLTLLTEHSSDKWAPFLCTLDLKQTAGYPVIHLFLQAEDSLSPAPPDAIKGDGTPSPTGPLEAQSWLPDPSGFDSIVDMVS